MLSASLLVSMSVFGQACEVSSASQNAAKFPLRAEPHQRYLVDAAGKPFFLHGDTAWSLIAELTREEADRYLRDRQARGFNTILINLLEHMFATNAPANAYGDRPFRTDGDYTTPNEPYFEHADWVVRRACELGFLVLLAPSYAGIGGGAQGWYHEMTENGAEKLRDYGRFLGKRYGNLDNIMWVQGGDYNPPDKDLIRALVSGIRENDPDALHTAHGSPGSSALEHWSGEPWLSINNVYSYDSIFNSALEQYARSEAMPFFLMESQYENEHDATEHRVRMQAYQAILSGAFGHMYGNNPIWHFGGQGWSVHPKEWQQGLDSPGARSMTVLKQLILPTRWWLLEPDFNALFLIDGRGDHNAPAVAARAKDGSFALVYLPDERTVTVDLQRLAGPQVTAQWLDPSTGQVLAIDGSPFAAKIESFTPSQKNHSGFGDWVLKLSSSGGMDQSPKPLSPEMKAPGE